MFKPLTALLGILVLGISFLTACQLPARSSETNAAIDPASTATPSPTITPTNTPLPTPTATPIPRARVKLGDKWLFYGDYDSAAEEYRLAYENDIDPDTRSAALLGTARVFLLQGETTRALNTLRELLDAYPETPYLAEANFFLGEVFAQLDRYTEAAQAYNRYLELNPGSLDAFVQEKRGDMLYADGSLAEALGAYEAAINSPGAGDRTELLTKLALAYRLNDQAETALLVYQDILNHASDDYQRAQMLLLIGQTHIEMGDSEQAFASYLEAVENYPLAYDSYTALVELVNNDQPVSELDRGLVDYFAGQYSVAQAAFERYLSSNPGDFEGEATANYYRGMTFRALGEYTAAIDSWDTVIQNYDTDSLWDNAWEQKGYTQWAYLDQYPEAVETFLNFVEKAPAHPRAPEFLDFAARVAERNGDLDTAADIWDRVTIDYPNSEQIYRASFLAGISYYRQQRFDEARSAFERALSQTPAKTEKSAALLWIGKTLHAKGNPIAAGDAWQQAAVLDPTGYYAERSRELVKGIDPFTPPIAYDFSHDPKAELQAADDWVRSTFQLPPETDLSAPGPLAADERLQRGTQLWDLGFYDEARVEFEDLRQAVENDPADTYRLGKYMIDIGLYRPGIIAIRQVLNLAGMDDAATLEAPQYFTRLRFGPYFSELIIPDAQGAGFHPLFIFSLARQESLFEGFVRSSAGARGVMQIIPSTGQSIAARLGWPPGYTDDDLYRPDVNIRLGTDYLAQLRDLFDGNLYAALAAYNGGPGNAQIWQSLAGDDPDLLLEIIRFEETRRYVRSIFEIYNLYYQLYDRSP
jgi:soluble lytic murein transglycosylase